MIYTNKHITLDRKTNKPVIKGTKITVNEIINLILEGWGIKKIREKYNLTRDQIEAVLKHNLVKEKSAVYVCN